MIKEAADTIIQLKTTLDEIRTGKVDVNTGLRRITNHRRPNGIESMAGLAQAEGNFLGEVTVMTSGGDVMQHALKDEDIREHEYQVALEELRNYRHFLRDARIRDDARMIGSADETEVDEPVF